MKMGYLLAVAAITVSVSSNAMAFDVEFVNQSNWEIHEIYFSSAKARQWGEDYLGDDVLEKGDALTLSNVEAGKWDVLIIDEDGDKCIVENVTLKSSDRWVITDADLLGCQAGS